MKKVVEFCHVQRLNNGVGKRKQPTSNGTLPHWGANLPYKQRVTGSSPVGPIIREI